MEETNTSKVARLRQQLEQECEALHRGLYGLASVAAHEIIRHRYQALGEYADELAKHVGQEQATDIMLTTSWRLGSLAGREGCRDQSRSRVS